MLKCYIFLENYRRPYIKIWYCIILNKLWIQHVCLTIVRKYWRCICLHIYEVALKNEIYFVTRAVKNVISSSEIILYLKMQFRKIYRIMIMTNWEFSELGTSAFRNLLLLRKKIPKEIDAWSEVFVAWALQINLWRFGVTYKASRYWRHTTSLWSE